MRILLYVSDFYHYTYYVIIKLMHEKVYQFKNQVDIKQQLLGN